MPIARLFLLLLLGLSLLPLNACVRQRDGDAGEVEVLRSGALNRAGDEDIPNVAYVNVRDMSNRVFHLGSQAEAWLGRKGFTVTDNPSQAGYIVQISVLAAGPVDPDSLRAVVDAGYDGPSKFSGTGGTALLADVLLVQRRVPSARRPSRANLKNISNRNAVASSQMRLGLLVRHDIRLKAGPALLRALNARKAPAWVQNGFRCNGGAVLFRHVKISPFVPKRRTFLSVKKR